VAVTFHTPGHEDGSDTFLRNVSNHRQDYSGRKITPNLGYVTVRGEEKMERARGNKTAKSLCEHV
jgi:hypothetical protein